MLHFSFLSLLQPLLQRYLNLISSTVHAQARGLNTYGLSPSAAVMSDTEYEQFKSTWQPQPLRPRQSKAAAPAVASAGPQVKPAHSHCSHRPAHQHRCNVISARPLTQRLRQLSSSHSLVPKHSPRGLRLMPFSLMLSNQMSVVCMV